MIREGRYGHAFRACAEPDGDGILLVEAGVTEVDLLGTEMLHFTWPVNGNGQSYRLHMPACLIKEGRIASETRLGPGEAVAVPLLARVQRAKPDFRYAIEHGNIETRIPDPDLNAQPRSVCLITAEADGPPADRLDATPDASGWLDGTRVSLDLHDAPLDEALRSLAAQLPVPVEVARDADYTATRVSLTARDEPARTVLGRLLGQCLLDGSASVGQLRFETTPAAPFETLPGPAWATPISCRYDLRDLLGRQTFVDATAAAAEISQAVCTSTWSSAERRIVPDDNGLVVLAAPAVQRAIADELLRRRRWVRVRVELVRLDDGAWTDLGLAIMADGTPTHYGPATKEADKMRTRTVDLDDDLRQRVIAAAALTGQRPEALEVTIRNGMKLAAPPVATSWCTGFSFSVRPVLSQDRRDIILEMEVMDSLHSVHPITSDTTLPAKGGGLIHSLGGHGIAVLLHAEVVP